MTCRATCTRPSRRAGEETQATRAELTAARNALDDHNAALAVGATVVRTNPALANAAQKGGVDPEAIAAAVAAATKAIMSPRGSPSPRSPHHSGGQLGHANGLDSGADLPSGAALLLGAAPLQLPMPPPQGSPLRGNINRGNSLFDADDGSDTSSSSNAPPSPPVAAIAGQRPGLPQGAHDPHIDWRSVEKHKERFSAISTSAGHGGLALLGDVVAGGGGGTNGRVPMHQAIVDGNLAEGSPVESHGSWAPVSSGGGRGRGGGRGGGGGGGGDDGGSDAGSVAGSATRSGSDVHRRIMQAEEEEDAQEEEEEEAEEFTRHKRGEAEENEMDFYEEDEEEESWADDFEEAEKLSATSGSLAEASGGSFAGSSARPRGGGGGGGGGGGVDSLLRHTDGGSGGGGGESTHR